MNLSESLCLERLFGKWLVVGQDKKQKQQQQQKNTRREQSRQSVSLFIPGRKTDSTSSPYTSRCRSTPTGSHFGSTTSRLSPHSYRNQCRQTSVGSAVFSWTHSLSNLLLFPQNFFTYYGEGSFNFFGLFLTVTLFCHLNQSKRLCS